MNNPIFYNRVEEMPHEVATRSDLGAKPQKQGEMGRGSGFKCYKYTERQVFFKAIDLEIISVQSLQWC